MSSLTTSSRRAETCPRCDYDLRGVRASWTDTCPLSGTCPECGLDFAWREICGSAHGPRWCIEFAPRRLVAALVTTSVRALAPWRFWAQLSMAHPVRPRRLLLFGAVWVAPLLIAYVGIQTTSALAAHRSMRSEIAMMQAWHPRMITASQRALADPALAELPPEARAERVARINTRIARAKARIATPDVLMMSPAVAVAEAVLLPFARTSRGYILQAGGRRAVYPDPAHIHRVALRFSNGPDVSDLISGAALSAWTAGMAPCIPAAFVLLPVTRRRRRVRWRHIVRVTVYGMFLSVGFVLAQSALTITRAPAPWSPLILAWILLVLAAQVVWWHAAIGRYLRLPHALPTAALLVVLAGLLPAAAAWVAILR